MKRLLRILISLVGGALGAGLLALTFSVAHALEIFDAATQLSSVALAILYSVFALAGLLLTFIFEPMLMRKIMDGLKRLENRLTQIPMQDVLSGLAGLIIGLILALLLSTLINRIPLAWISVPLSVIVYIVLGYLGATGAVHRKTELFRPLRRLLPEGGEAENAGEPRDSAVSAWARKKSAEPKAARGGCPKILDTSVIIDGRIYDLAKTGFLEGKLVVPAFVLGELRHIADSADALRRQRGRRGLDILNAMQTEMKSLQVVEKDYENMEVDEKLIRLAKEMKGKVVTNDFNLNKVATVKGVEVLNINQLANALKPAVLPGEMMNIQIVNPGKEQGQGVGYLDDGTMIVVDGGRNRLGEQLDVMVTSVLQTAAGRMIFAKISA